MAADMYGSSWLTESLACGVVTPNISGPGDSMVPGWPVTSNRKWPPAQPAGGGNTLVTIRNQTGDAGVRPGIRAVSRRGGKGRCRVRDGDRLGTPRPAALAHSSEPTSLGRYIDPVAALTEQTGGLADVAVDVTAKAPAAFGTGDSACIPARQIVAVAGTRVGSKTGIFADVAVFGASRVCLAPRRRHRLPGRVDSLVSGRHPSQACPPPRAA